MTMDHFYAVIMAGGGGTRLWPLSRKDRPKQTLRLLGDRSLFQRAVDRVLPLIPPERVRIVTIEEQVDLLKEQAPELPDRAYILEPAPKGTASVVGLAAVMLEKADSEAVMAVLTADHAISNESQFRNLLAASYSAAQQGHLVTLGVEPTEPATGYGYLKQGEKLEDIGEFALHRVEAFREKPDDATARAYFESGDHVWNSGMFVWRAERILAEMEKLMPTLLHGLRQIQSAIGMPSLESVTKQTWRGLESQTIDYGIMEKAEEVAMLPAGELGWRDVGSWDSLFEVFETDKDGNLLLSGEPLLLDSQGNLVVQEEGQSRLIAGLGVKNLIIIDTGSALLITTREQAQGVKKLVQVLEKQGREQYL